jgi:KaiC/GvpD/RAD55 family RecA-like ATPase
MGNLVKTGIAGLDSMLYGGIPEGNQVILAGIPGAGKTLLSFEYLYRNAKLGFTSVFFALEESPERVVENAKSEFSEFKDIDELIRSKKLIVDGEDPATVMRGSSSGGNASQYEFGKVVADIESTIVSTHAKRVVIDSLSLFDMLISDQVAYRRAMLALVSNLRRLGVTSLLTAEMATPERSKLSFKAEYFIFDGIIIMYAKGEEEKRMLAMEVIKTRGNNHSFVTTPYEISPHGINVMTAEEMGL